MKLIRYKSNPLQIVGATVAGAFYGTFLRRFAGHQILEAILFIVGVSVIVLAFFYHPSFLSDHKTAPRDEEDLRSL